MHFFLKKFGHIKKKQYLCTRFRKFKFEPLKHFISAWRNMVVIAQLAEHRIVVPSVVGSSPTIHPTRGHLVSRLFM